MMDKLKKNMVFYLLLLIDFYIVPCFIDANYQEFIDQLDAMNVDSLAEWMTPRLQEAEKLFRPDGN